MDRFFEVKQRHDNHKTQGELAVLQEADVVGMTTTGVVMDQTLVEALGARIVVVEEAAEVGENIAFVATTRIIVLAMLFDLKCPSRCSDSSRLPARSTGNDGGLPD